MILSAFGVVLRPRFLKRVGLRNLEMKKYKPSNEEIAQACLDCLDKPDQFPIKLKLPWFSKFVRPTDEASDEYKLRDLLNHWDLDQKQIKGSEKPCEHGHRIINPVYLWPYLEKVGFVSGSLSERCHEILGTDTTAKQLRPFTSEEFESSFAVGAIVRIRLSRDKNIKRTQLAEIEYKPDSESQIQSVTFGGKEYTLPELKDNLEYWRHDQWHPFGVIE